MQKWQHSVQDGPRFLYQVTDFVEHLPLKKMMGNLGICWFIVRRWNGDAVTAVAG